MAITRGQASGLAVVGSGTSLAVTWGVNPSAGNTILVFVQCANAPSSVVDNGTTPSTFTLDKSTAGGQGAYIYRANNITLPGAGSYSVTVTTSTLTTIGGAGIEYAGVASGPPTATNSSSGTGTSAATGSAAPAGSGGLVFGGFSDTSGLNPETITFTGPSPQAEQFRETNGASFWPWAVADALTGSAQNFTWTLGDSVAAGGVAAAYDATGTGGGGGTNPTWDPAGSYTMVFDDEFTGTTLDTSKWQPVDALADFRDCGGVGVVACPLRPQLDRVDGAVAEDISAEVEQAAVRKPRPGAHAAAHRLRPQHR
jgi:hypothetical protein